MFNSITCQIKKLDKDIDGCKERLNALKAKHTKNPGKLSRHPNVPVRRSKSAMNRKKVSANKDHETGCKKHKCSRSVNEKARRDKDIESPCKRSRKIKQRSRSASCGRDCDCISENQFHHNDLIPQKLENHPKQKNSWANILKEHNTKKLSSYPDSKGYSEYNKYVFPTSIYLKNRGVQCTETLFAPSKTNVTAETGFTPYSPTRTLQFLLSEIRENLKHKRPDKMLNIINDMEDAIYRIKSDEDYRPAFQPKVLSNHNIDPPLNNNLYPNQEMHKIFEEGFAKLETTCKTLELTCARLKEENTQLQLEIQKKDNIISMLEKKDKDNLDKIDLLNKHIFMMNQKGDEYTQSIQELTKMINKLQQENKCVEPLRELTTQLELKLNQLTNQKSDYIYENQLVKLENEKLKVLLQVKEKHLSNFKQIFLGFEEKVKKDVKVMQGRCVSEDSETESSAPLCSSPNTSASVMAPAYGSWRGLSRVSSQASVACQDVPAVDRAFRHDAIPPKVDTSRLIIPPPKTDAIEDIRGQIKKMFTQHTSRVKTVCDNNAGNPQWTNLASLHSSITSYNTTT